MTTKVFTDGGARGNPGPAAAAYVVVDGAGKVREKCGKYLGVASNNEAEYQAVIEALAAVPDQRLAFYLDSLLVVSQLNGVWKVKEPRLRELLLKARTLEAGRQITYSHVPRSQNALADLLVNETLDSQMG